MQEITIDKTSDTVQTMLLEKDTIRTEPNGLTPEIYASVRKSVGMKEYNREDVETALQNTLFSVVIREKEQPIGIGRVIGDGRIAFFIKDVAIIPERQGQGIGIMIMEKLMEYVHNAGAANAYAGLMALKGTESFYKKFGFHVRPYQKEGSGMTQYLNEHTDETLIIQV